MNDKIIDLHKFEAIIFEISGKYKNFFDLFSIKKKNGYF